MGLPGLWLTLLCSSFTCFNWIWEFSRDWRVLQIPKMPSLVFRGQKTESEIMCKNITIKQGDLGIPKAIIPHVDT